MRVHLCGVRGSTPATGSAFACYGGDTSCVAIARDGADPTLLLDAGTGLAQVDAIMNARPFRGTILLSHLHWDHTHGLPFFRSGDQAAAVVRVLLPAQAGSAAPGGGADELLARAMSPPHFPITPGELRGSWSFGALEEGRHDLEGFAVHAGEIPHKGGRTFGYRVDDGTHALAYLPDHGPIALGDGPGGFGPYHETALALARDVDLLIHDAQYTNDEYAVRREFGHSTIEYALGLAAAAQVRHLLLFHHDPGRTDDELDQIQESLLDAPVPTSVARQGQVLRLG